MKRRSPPSNLIWLDKYGREETVTVLRSYPDSKDHELVIAVGDQSGRLWNLKVAELAKKCRNQIEWIRSQETFLPLEFPPTAGEADPLVSLINKLPKIVLQSPYIEDEKLPKDKFAQLLKRRREILGTLTEELNQLLEVYRAGFLEIGGAPTSGERLNRKKVELSVAVRECHAATQRGEGVQIGICRNYLERFEIKGKPDYTAKQLSNSVSQLSRKIELKKGAPPKKET